MKQNAARVMNFRWRFSDYLLKYSETPSGYKSILDAGSDSPHMT